MKIIISPAKSLDLESSCPKITASHPVFLNQAQIIMRDLSRYAPNDLSKLMSISANLANLNWERNQAWNTAPEKGRAAIYSFTGDVYKGIDIKTLKSESVNWLQDKLWILSGLYGLLKPLDLIQAYRLEMGTKLPLGAFKNLYEFWGTAITEKINESCDGCLVNLASVEYAKVIDMRKLKAKVITPVFKDEKNGKLKTIGIFAKKARGSMVRYIAENRIEDSAAIKGFNGMDYMFAPNLSDNKKWVFIR